MMKALPLAALALLSATALSALAPASAQMRPGWMVPAQERGGERQSLVPLRQIVDMLRSRYGGELISARLEEGPHPTYFLRWRMPDNQVRDFRVDAVSGQIR